MEFGAVTDVIKPLDDGFVVAVEPSDAVLGALYDLVDASRNSCQVLLVSLLEQFDLREIIFF